LDAIATWLTLPTVEGCAVVGANATPALHYQCVNRKFSSRSTPSLVIVQPPNLVR
jgi:hypothetical protein